jgi:hypothetical protein
MEKEEGVKRDCRYPAGPNYAPLKLHFEATEAYLIFEPTIHETRSG